MVRHRHDERDHLSDDRRARHNNRSERERVAVSDVDRRGRVAVAAVANRDTLRFRPSSMKIRAVSTVFNVTAISIITRTTISASRRALALDRTDGRLVGGGVQLIDSVQLRSEPQYHRLLETGATARRRKRDIRLAAVLVLRTRRPAALAIVAVGSGRVHHRTPPFMIEFTGEILRLPQNADAQAEFERFAGIDNRASNITSANKKSCNLVRTRSWERALELTLVIEAAGNPISETRLPRWTLYRFTANWPVVTPLRRRGHAHVRRLAYVPPSAGSRCRRKGCRVQPVQRHGTSPITGSAALARLFVFGGGLGLTVTRHEMRGGRGRRSDAPQWAFLLRRQFFLDRARLHSALAGFIWLLFRAETIPAAGCVASTHGDRHASLQ